MEYYFRLVDNVLEKHKVPTKLIQQHVRDLANQMQLVLSHNEQFYECCRKCCKKLPGPVRELRGHQLQSEAAMEEAVKIMRKIQQYASIEGE